MEKGLNHYQGHPSYEGDAKGTVCIGIHMKEIPLNRKPAQPLFRSNFWNLHDRTSLSAL